jgi:hypothetical protein
VSTKQHGDFSSQSNLRKMGYAHVQVTRSALLSIVTQYNREAGVRALERAIGGVVRFKAVEWAAHVDARGLSLSSAPSPVSLLPSSHTVDDADTACGSDKSASNGDAGWITIAKLHCTRQLEGVRPRSRINALDEPGWTPSHYTRQQEILDLLSEYGSESVK